jgi:multiple sugar transport system substrate-binding protein
MEWFQYPARRLGLDQIIRFRSSAMRNQMGDMDWPFMIGSFSVVIDGQWRVEQLARMTPDIEYSTAPPPHPAGVRSSHLLNGNICVIPKNARCPRGAWAFMRFWAGLDDPNQGAEFAIWGGWIPCRPAMIESPIYQAYLKKYPQLKTFTDLVGCEDPQLSPPVPYQGYLIDRTTSVADSVSRLSLTPAQAIDLLSRDIANHEKLYPNARSKKN